MTEDRWDGYVLEIKVPNLQTYLKYKREGLADYIQLQLQAYLAVTGKPWRVDVVLVTRAMGGNPGRHRAGMRTSST